MMSLWYPVVGVGTKVDGSLNSGFDSDNESDSLVGSGSELDSVGKCSEIEE